MTSTAKRNLYIGLALVAVIIITLILIMVTTGNNTTEESQNQESSSEPAGNNTTEESQNQEGSSEPAGDESGQDTQTVSSGDDDIFSGYAPGSLAELKEHLARSDVSSIEKVDAFAYFVRGYESGESKPEQPRYEPVASYRMSADQFRGLLFQEIPSDVPTALQPFFIEWVEVVSTYPEDVLPPLEEAQQSFADIALKHKVAIWDDDDNSDIIIAQYNIPGLD